MVVDAVWEREFNLFLEQQKRAANARRLEMLEKDLLGTKKLLKEVIWPVFCSFDGFELEYELKGVNGVSIFLDVFYTPLRLAFECEGFSAHAETITRRRFDFEKYRVRLMLLQGICYVPFSWDELDDKNHLNVSYLRELIGKWTSGKENELSIYEREVIRAYGGVEYVFNAANVCDLIGKKKSFSQKVIKSLHEKGLIKPHRPGLKRHHDFLVEAGALQSLRT
ncbi:hypothetical protein [Paenibacillus sp. PL2-23]|uniref:hypothetical protein n=1 Tax=Paenibacillus sp. PL2-23 TaxID=2100729 RepID=UPI0030FB9102